MRLVNAHKNTTTTTHHEGTTEMAVYFRHECRECGMQVVNNDKLKRYVHANMAPEREPHRPTVRAVKVGAEA